MKLLLTTLIVLSSFFVNANDHPITIPAAAATAFKTAYKGASNVHWSLVNGLYRAQFNYQHQLLYAFYNEEGECISVGEVIEFKQLPVMLQAAFTRKNIKGELIDVFEVSNEMEVGYYITVATETEKIIFKSAGTSKWEVFKKEKSVKHAR